MSTWISPTEERELAHERARLCLAVLSTQKIWVAENKPHITTYHPLLDDEQTENFKTLLLANAAKFLLDEEV